MIRYLVDTGTCIYTLKRHPAVIARMERIRTGEAGMSIVSFAELCFGAWKSQCKEQNQISRLHGGWLM
jgi:tRNA(fMet)-specific endonuclease VapC